LEHLERLRSQDYFKDDCFEGLDLADFDFSGKDFYRCTFRHSKLTGTRWLRARLEDCAFEDCDLTQMQPGDSSALGVRFLRCKLMGITWDNLSVSSQLAFEECNLRYASFVRAPLRKTPFLRCRAQEASFLDCDLQGADFASTDLAGANFQGADLRDADLSQAENVFVDPAKNRIRGLRVSVDTAAALATSLGMRVAGYEQEAPRPAPRGKARR
jgi:uncharacterized protein YjbI with pentapeptide repeats